MPATWSRKRKLLVGVAGVILISGVVALNLLRQNPEKARGDAVETVRVQRGRVVEQLKETGRIEFVRTVEVKSTVSGEIVQLLAEPGDPVKAEATLAVIRPDPNQTLQLYNKRAAVARARIDLDQSRKALNRKEKLHQSNLVSQEALERARDKLEKLRNTYRLALLELETLETRGNIRRQDRSTSKSDGRLDDVRILCPASGIVIARPVEVGEVVVSGIVSTVTGTSMFLIGDPSQMMINADISEVDVGRLKPGLPVRIIVDAYPDTTYQGEVHRIAPVGRIRQGGNIVTFNTEILILNTDPRLRQGMSCDIDIIFSERDSTLYVPAEAAYEDYGEETGTGDKKGVRGRSIVYRKQDDAFVEHDVRFGVKSDVRLEVLSGLALDDEVAADAEKMYKENAEKKKKAGKEDRPKADND